MELRSEKIAITDDEVRFRHQNNRAAWNEAANKYTEENEERVRLLKTGKSSLHPIERRNLERLGGASRVDSRISR
jgi:hypothetical protein